MSPKEFSINHITPLASRILRSHLNTISNQASRAVTRTFSVSKTKNMNKWKRTILLSQPRNSSLSNTMSLWTKNTNHTKHSLALIRYKDQSKSNSECLIRSNHSFLTFLIQFKKYSHTSVDTSDKVSSINMLILTSHSHFLPCL